VKLSDWVSVCHCQVTLRMLKSVMLVAVGLIAVLAVLAPTGVEGIWCFQCNSRVDAECVDLTVNSTRSSFYKECELPEDRQNVTKEDLFCRKIVQKIHDRDGLVRVVRKCGWKKGTKPCYTVSNMGHKDEVCQCFNDACNAAALQKPAVVVPLVSLCVSIIGLVRL